MSAKSHLERSVIHFGTNLMRLATSSEASFRSLALSEKKRLFSLLVLGLQISKEATTLETRSIPLGSIQNQRDSA